MSRARLQQLNTLETATLAIYLGRGRKHREGRQGRIKDKECVRARERAEERTGIVVCVGSFYHGNLKVTVNCNYAHTLTTFHWFLTGCRPWFGNGYLPYIPTELNGGGGRSLPVPARFQSSRPLLQ